MRLLRISAALLAAALLAGCGANPETARVSSTDGTAVFEVEVADSGKERAVGLMGRSELAGDAGMLFVFPEPVRQQVLDEGHARCPLSVAFLDEDNRILRILDMEPCEADPCPFYDAGVVYRAALEVNRGAFARAGLEEGDVVRVER